MSDESVIRDSDGNPTHVRVTSNDGSESTLYEYDGSIGANLTGDHRGKAVEVSEHHDDGTTDAYEYDNSMGANLTGDHRGEQKNESGGLCFLTTACVQHSGLPDDCHELVVLREFRDTYVCGLPGGAGLIADYYAMAPRIVRAIEQSPARVTLLDATLAEIREIVSLIENKEPAAAVMRYRTMCERLQRDVTND